MPHIVIQMYPGRSHDDKTRLTEAIVRDVCQHTGCAESSVSVAIEDVSAPDWPEKVYRAEIAPALETLYKKPGYSM